MAEVNTPLVNSVMAKAQVQYEAIVYDLLCCLANRLHTSLQKELSVDLLLANRKEYKLSMHILKQIFRLRLLERKDKDLQRKQFSDSCGKLEKLFTTTLRSVQKSPLRQGSQDSRMTTSDLQLSTEKSKSPRVLKLKDSIQSSITEHVEAEQMVSPQNANSKQEIDTLYTQQTSVNSVQETSNTQPVVIINQQPSAKKIKTDVLPILALSGDRQQKTQQSPKNNAQNNGVNFTTQGSAASFGKQSIVKSSEPMVLAVGGLAQTKYTIATKESNRTNSRGTETTRVNSRHQTNPKSNIEMLSNGISSDYERQITPELFKHQPTQSRVQTQGAGKRKLIGNSKIMPVHGIELQRNRSKDKLSTKESLIQKKLFSDVNQSAHTNSFGLMEVTNYHQADLNESNLESGQQQAQFHTSSMGSLPSIPENIEEGKTSRGITSRESKSKNMNSYILDTNNPHRHILGSTKNLPCGFELTGEKQVPMNDYISASPHDHTRQPRIFNQTLTDIDNKKMMPPIKHVRNPKFRTQTGGFDKTASFIPKSKTTTPTNIPRNGAAFKSVQRPSLNRGVVQGQKNFKHKRHSQVPHLTLGKIQSEKNNSYMFSSDTDSVKVRSNKEEPLFKTMSGLISAYDSTVKKSPESNPSSDRRHYQPINKSKSGTSQFKVYGHNHDKQLAAFAQLQSTNTKKKKFTQDLLM